MPAVTHDSTDHLHDDSDPTDPALLAERRYLAAARSDLARMRERTLSLSAHGGDRVSSEYLAATLHHRAASLIDDPQAALFFGRTDHTGDERWYIGRRHVADPDGDPVVIDWRAEVSRAFYRASRTEPMGVVRRRRFGVEGGQLTAYEDEYLLDQEPAGHAPGQAAERADGRSQILAREIERPRVGPMRDIVATIQPEQDEIVRADVATSVCVQGAPGTGKTAVGLHRAAWLLYAHRDKLSRSGVLVVGPNAAFLEHVAAVLPSLGEVQVRHTTLDALVRPRPAGTRRPAVARAKPAAARAGASHSTADAVERAVLQGDARLAEVLHRAVWSHLSTPTEALVLPRGVRRWRLAAYTTAEIVSELRARGARYAAARDMLPQRLAHALLVLMEEAGESPDDRIQDAVARSREVRRYVDACWPALAPAQVLFRLLADRGFLARCAEGILTEAEQHLLAWTTPPRSAGSARWTPAELVLLDELGDVLQRTPSLGHVVLDEAQDLSPMQLRAVGRRCSTGSMTILGDIAQGTTPWATPSWADSLAHLGHDGAVLVELDRGFRVPSAVIEFAAQLLPDIAPELSPPGSVREDPGSLHLVEAPTATALWPALLRAARVALGQEGSVGVIVPDEWTGRAAKTLAGQGIDHLVLGAGAEPADGTAEALLDAALGEDDAPLPRVSVVPATTAKGLEYDQVIVLEPARIAADEPDVRTGLRRLYVVLTRAVTGLTVIHHEPLPAALTR
ncbi:MAG: AAA family ATPase [Kineosporiaceae bacterium]